MIFCKLFIVVCVDMSFADSIYSDVFYFVEGRTISNSFWTIKQLRLTKHGYFRILDTFVVRNFANEWDGSMMKTAPSKEIGGDHPSQLLFSLDVQHRRLFSVEKNGKRKVFSTCPYDLLFR